MSPNTSAFWQLTGAGKPGARKVRADAVLLNLRAEAQELVFEWCNKPMDRDAAGEPIKGTGGHVYARQQLHAVADRHSAPWLRVSERLVSAFWRAYGLNLVLQESQRVEEAVVQETGNKRLAREVAEDTFMRQALVTRDIKMFGVAASAAESRRSNELREQELKAKVDGFKARYKQKERELELAWQKRDDAMSTELEKAYAALAEELKHNAPAAAAFAALRAMLPPK